MLGSTATGHTRWLVTYYLGNWSRGVLEFFLGFGGSSDGVYVTRSETGAGGGGCQNRFSGFRIPCHRVLDVYEYTRRNRTCGKV